jgi:hypothetical protein
MFARYSPASAPFLTISYEELAMSIAARGLSLIFLALLPLAVPSRVPARLQDCSNPLLVTSLLVLGQDTTVDCVTITPGGALELAGHRLTITGNSGLSCQGYLKVDGILILSGGGTHTISGTVDLPDSTSVCWVKSSCTISGTGQVRGWHAGALIAIDPGATLTNAATIKGHLSIARSGLIGVIGLRNEGVISADAKPLTIGSGLALTDIANARWRANGTGTLIFNSGALALKGTFELHGGATLLIRSIIVTGGVLDYSNGVVTLPLPLLSYFKYGATICQRSINLPPNPLIGPITIDLNCP